MLVFLVIWAIQTPPAMGPEKSIPMPDMKTCMERLSEMPHVKNKIGLCEYRKDY